MMSFRIYRAAPSLLWVALLSAAACDDGEELVLATPEIATEPAAPANLSFDTFVLGLTNEVAPQVVEVRNEGIGRLSIEVAVEGRDGSQFLVTEAPAFLEAGREAFIFVRFRPEVHRDMQADLVIRSNDGDEPELRFPLTARAEERCRMSMAPTEMNMLLGEIRTVELRNPSLSPCNIEFLEVTGGVFSLFDPPEVPFTVESGGRVPLRVLHDGQLLNIGTPAGEVVARDAQGSRESAVVRGEAAVGGCIQFRPRSRVVFEATPVGETSEDSLRIENTCGRSVRVRSMNVSFGTSDFFVGGEFAGGFQLEGGEVVTVPLFFRPFISGILSGTLTVATTDVETLIYPIDLIGQGDAPIIDVFPSSLDFGDVKYRPAPDSVSECVSRTQTVFVYSRGRAELTLEDIQVEGASDDRFEITGLAVFSEQNGENRLVETPSLGQTVTLPSQHRLEVTLQFFPSRLDPETHNGTLRLEHDAEGQLTRIPLRGQAEPDQPVVDRFDQASGPQVDILWVIDDSCSMVDEQARLIGNLEQFVSFADEQDADYQMAVTNTDGVSSNAGRFERCFPFPAVISSDFPEREEAFRCTFDVGTGGTGIEAGMGAAKAALQRAQEEEPNINSGFLRENADLAVVIMSDEDDQSIESTQNLVQFFRTVKGPGRGDRVKVHAIAGPTTESCQNEEGRFLAQPGFRYEDVVRSFGGNFFNICLSDWSPVLTELGLDTFKPLDTWFLSQPADPSSLRVFVNGGEVVVDPVDGYVYDFEANAVRFSGASIPPARAQVEVRYDSLCAP